jgi:hypothetical protein
MRFFFVHAGSLDVHDERRQWKSPEHERCPPDIGYGCDGGQHPAPFGVQVIQAIQILPVVIYVFQAKLFDISIRPFALQSSSGDNRAAIRPMTVR